VTVIVTRKDARLDPSGQYRYTLTRAWDRDLILPSTALTLDGGNVLWVMLNPSVADWELDDPTIKRCVGFSRAWGYDRLTVVNLFAHRATDPSGLSGAWDPVGPDNDRTILDEAAKADRIVCAWGVWGVTQGRHRKVLDMLSPFTLYHLGLTKGRQPRHPLYVPSSTHLVLWDRPSLAA
jgi:hypothetical protein